MQSWSVFRQEWPNDERQPVIPWIRELSKYDQEGEDEKRESTLYKSTEENTLAANGPLRSQYGDEFNNFADRYGYTSE